MTDDEIASLVRTYYSLVFGVACGILRDRTETEDVAQETFATLGASPGFTAQEAISIA